MTGLRAALLLGCLGMCLALSAQPTAPMTTQDSTALRVKRTTVWAACLPGSGQIINRQAWKAPVVWGGMGYALWATMNNAQEMRASIDDLIAATDDDPTTEPVLTDAAATSFPRASWKTAPCFTGGTGTCLPWDSSLPTDCKCWTPTRGPCFVIWTPRTI